MSIAISPFLRNVLRVDAAMSLAAGLLCAAASGVLSGLLALPQGLLFWAGVALLPWAAFLYGVARRSEASRLVLLDIVAINALWAAASVAILVGGIVQPNLLGAAFVLVQAAAVAGLALVQFGASRRPVGAAA